MYKHSVDFSKSLPISASILNPRKRKKLTPQFFRLYLALHKQPQYKFYLGSVQTSLLLWTCTELQKITCPEALRTIRYNPELKKRHA